MRPGIILLLAILTAISLGSGCSDPEADGDADSDADVDGDVDSDVDGDVDADVDGDGDSDGDEDGDVEPDADEGPEPPRLLINEVMTSPPEDETDWVELIAVGDELVNLSDYTLVDDQRDREPVALPDVTLEEGQFHVIIASREPPDEETFYLPFQLGRNDSLTLARDGVEVDHLEWNEEDILRDGTYGRYPDGFGEDQPLDPTPGAPNVAYVGPEHCNGDNVFLTDVVQEVRIEIEEEYWEEIRLDPEAEVFYPANLEIGERRVEEIAFRTKGNSSLRTISDSGSVRFPFKIDINRYVDGQEFCDERMLNLSPGFLDPSYMREHISFSMARDFGIPAPRTGHVDLYVNDVHLGLYTLVEAVDGDFVDENFEPDNGDLYKAEPPGGTLVYVSSDRMSDYRGMDLETNEETSDHGAFLEFVHQLNRGRLAELDRVLNIDETLRYLAFSTLLTNLDSYLGPGHNYYLYEQEGIFHVIPWDLNETFGTFNCRCNRPRLINHLIDEPTCGPLEERPLVARLFADEANIEAYHEFLQELLDTIFTVEEMDARIDEVHDRILPFVEAAVPFSYTVEQFERSLEEDVVALGEGSHVRVAIGLRAFVRERRASIMGQLAGDLPSTNEGRGACAGGDTPHPCGDGVCDEYERTHPDVCPEDCVGE